MMNKSRATKYKRVSRNDSAPQTHHAGPGSLLHFLQTVNEHLGEICSKMDNLLASRRMKPDTCMVLLGAAEKIMKLRGFVEIETNSLNRTMYDKRLSSTEEPSQWQSRGQRYVGSQLVQTTNGKQRIGNNQPWQNLPQHSGETWARSHNAHNAHNNPAYGLPRTTPSQSDMGMVPMDSRFMSPMIPASQPAAQPQSSASHMPRSTHLSMPWEYKRPIPPVPYTHPTPAYAHLQQRNSAMFLPATHPISPLQSMAPNFSPFGNKHDNKLGSQTSGSSWSLSSGNGPVGLNSSRFQGSYFCPVCSKPFKHRGNFLAHVRTHTGEKPYTCPQCGRGFAQRSNLKRHLSRVHHVRPPSKSNKTSVSGQSNANSDVTRNVGSKRNRGGAKSSLSKGSSDETKTGSSSSNTDGDGSTEESGGSTNAVAQISRQAKLNIDNENRELPF